MLRGVPIKVQLGHVRHAAILFFARERALQGVHRFFVNPQRVPRTELFPANPTAVFARPGVRFFVRLRLRETKRQSSLLVWVCCTGRLANSGQTVVYCGQSAVLYWAMYGQTVTSFGKTGHSYIAPCGQTVTS